MPGASPQTRRVTNLNANWQPNYDLLDGRFDRGGKYKPMAVDEGDRCGGQAAGTDDCVELEGPESAPGGLLNERRDADQRHVDGHIPQGHGR